MAERRQRPAHLEVLPRAGSHPPPCREKHPRAGRRLPPAPRRRDRFPRPGTLQPPRTKVVPYNSSPPQCTRLSLCKSPCTGVHPCNPLPTHWRSRSRRGLYLPRAAHHPGPRLPLLLPLLPGARREGAAGPAAARLLALCLALSACLPNTRAPAPPSGPAPTLSPRPRQFPHSPLDASAATSQRRNHAHLPLAPPLWHDVGGGVLLGGPRQEGAGM